MNELKELYEKAREIPPHEAMHRVMEAKTEEERQFWAYIHDMNLQRAQKRAIEQNLF